MHFIPKRHYVSSDSSSKMAAIPGIRYGTHCDSRPKSDVTNLGEHIFLLSQAYLTITLELFKIHIRPDVY